MHSITSLTDDATLAEAEYPKRIVQEQLVLTDNRKLIRQGIVARSGTGRATGLWGISPPLSPYLAIAFDNSPTNHESSG